MGSKNKLHVGFPAVSLAKYAKILVDKNFTVCVVEQVQSPDNDKEKEEDGNSGKKSKAKKKNGSTFMGRQVSAILSRGLFNIS